MKALKWAAGWGAGSWAAVGAALAAIGLLLVGIRVVTSPVASTSSAGAASSGSPAPPSASVPPSTTPTASSTTPPTPPPTAPSHPGTATTRATQRLEPSAAGLVSKGWHITVYYTAVESYHHGTPTSVTGCSGSDCSEGSDDLGTYPDDFVDAVRNEGTGRITSGSHAGRYLNWSSDVGFWLDTIPATGWHTRLLPFTSSASDDGQLPRGTRFRVDSACAQIAAEVDTQACSLLRSKTWVVDDEFTPGLGGSKHVDLYIGEEDREGFESTSPTFIDVNGVSLRVLR